MSKQKPQYIMSHSELKNLKEDARDNRQLLNQMEREGYGQGNGKASGFDKARVLKQAAQLEALAERHSAPKISGAAKDRLAKQASELRQKISEGMLTSSEMNNLRKNPSAPLKHLEWEKRNSKNIHDYKQLMRRIEPNDPGASSVERFRR